MKECEYKGSFDSWESVVRNFTGKVYDDTFKLNKKDLPTEVLYAHYETENNWPGGYAFVVWRKGRKYYTLEGSHCSCYGLEEVGWDPEEFSSKKLFLEYLKKKTLYGFEDDIKKLIKRLS